MTEQIVKYNDLSENAKRYVVESVNNYIPRKMSFLNMEEYDDNKYSDIRHTSLFSQAFDYFDDAFSSLIPNATYQGLGIGIGDIPCWEWDFNDKYVISDRMGDVNFMFELIPNGDTYSVPHITLSMHHCDYELYGESEITKSNIEDCIRDLVRTSDVPQGPEFVEEYVRKFVESVLHAYKLFKNALSRADADFRRNLPYALDELFSKLNVNIIIDYDDYSGTFEVIDWNI